MKILHCNDSLASGGIEAMICSLANEMSKENEVEFFSIFELSEGDVFLKKLSSKVKVKTAHKKGKGVNLSILWRIYKIIKESNADVVHIHVRFFYYILPILLLHHKMKFVYTIHTDPKMENLNRDGQIFAIKKFFFRKNWITAVTISTSSQQSYKELYKCNAPLILNGIEKPVPLPISLDMYKITPNTKVFFHPGRISLAKNQVVLCKVFKRLTDKGKDVVLLIAGQNQDDGIFSEMKQYFSDRIIYLGERRDVVDILAASDAFCLPSIWEGLPVTLLEALSVSCIPICSSVGGIPEVITDMKDGLLSKTSSEDDYYETVVRYLKISQKDIALMKEEMKKTFCRFEISSVAKKYIDIYKDKN